MYINFKQNLRTLDFLQKNLPPVTLIQSYMWIVTFSVCNKLPGLKSLQMFLKFVNLLWEGPSFCSQHLIPSLLKT